MVAQNRSVVGALESQEAALEEIKQGILRMAIDKPERPYTFVKAVVKQFSGTNPETVQSQFQAMLDTHQVALDDDLRVISL